ncbi:hypothetical protein HG530_008777 [Fusarium avenaceum]|nr:hypothetical protein HG530_008777 [Fusarium avenaceum]
MLPTSMVNVVLGHRHLRSIENRRLTHVVPHPGVVHGTLEAVKLEHLLPPFDRLGVEAVNPVRRSRPAPSFVEFLFLVVNGEVLSDHLLRGLIAVGLLNVGVKKNN